MRKHLIAFFSFAAILLLSSCSKNSDAPKFAFTNNVNEGQANGAGEYTITGTLTSEVNLDKVTLTKEGQNNPFFIDDSEAKNKNTYTFAYLVTGINSNTYILIDAYDQDGGKTSTRFLIKK